MYKQYIKITSVFLHPIPFFFNFQAANDDNKPKAWGKYVFFNDIHYTRNLVFATENFEVMVVCWKKGQASRIHSHSGSQCWMIPLYGRIEEELYTLIDSQV